jgi:hypothetical protein
VLLAAAAAYPKLLCSAHASSHLAFFFDGAPKLPSMDPCRRCWAAHPPTLLCIFSLPSSTGPIHHARLQHRYFPDTVSEVYWEVSRLIVFIFFSDTSPILYRKRIGKYRYRIRITIPVRQLGDVSVGWKTGGNRFWDRAVWILLITRMKTLDGDTKQPKCIRVVVLLALRPFCVCGGRDNTLELNCHERFMINKAGESFL